MNGKGTVLDVIRLAHLKEYDVSILFGQDQDLSEVGEEIAACRGNRGFIAHAPRNRFPGVRIGVGAVAPSRKGQQR